MADIDVLHARTRCKVGRIVGCGDTLSEIEGSEDFRDLNIYVIRIPMTFGLQGGRRVGAIITQALSPQPAPHVEIYKYAGRWLAEVGFASELFGCNGYEHDA